LVAGLSAERQFSRAPAVRPTPARRSAQERECEPGASLLPHPGLAQALKQMVGASSRFIQFERSPERQEVGIALFENGECGARLLCLSELG
jgi:hypothetical protein